MNSSSHCKREPITKYFGSQNPTNGIDWSNQTKDWLISHLQRAYNHRGENRGIACPLPPDLNQRTVEELRLLAQHYYYYY